MNKTFRLSVCLLFVLGLTLVPSDSAEAQSASRRATSTDNMLEQRASSLARLGRTEEAVDLYLELLYKNPGKSNLYFRVSNLMPGAENAHTLLQILDDILKTQSKNSRLAADRGRLLYLLDRKEEAMSDWRGILQRSPNDRFLYTTISSAMLQAGASSEATDMLVEARGTLNDPLAFAYDLARIYAAKHNYDQASKEYLAHLDKNPGMLDHISNQLIRMLENDGAYELMMVNFKRKIQSPGNHEVLMLAQAKLYLHQKQYSECAAMVLSSDVNKSMKDVMAIANDLLAERAWVPAADLFLFISANSQDSRQIGEALLKLASTYEHRLQSQQDYQTLSGYFEGNQFLGLDVRLPAVNDVSLQRTLKLYDSLQTLLPRTNEAFLASYHIAEIQLMVSGDVDRAIRGFVHIFENAPRLNLRLTGGLRLIDAMLVKGDTTAALRTLDKLTQKLNIDEDDPQLVASRIKILIHQGDIARLKKELLNLSGSASPSDPIFNDGLELLALLEGNGGEDDPDLKLYLRGERLIGQHKLTEAIDVLQSIQGDPASIADEAAVRSIQIQLALKNSQDAVSQMDDFLNEYPESAWRANVLVWRGEHLQFEQQSPSAAIPYYEDVIVNHPGYLGVQEVRHRLRTLIGAGS